MTTEVDRPGRIARIAPPVLATWLLAWPGIVHGHGASRGLHLHCEPDPARAGGKITVRIDSSSPITQVRVGFVGSDAEIVRPRRPKRRLRLRLRVPETISGSTINCHAEATTSDGRVVRASAIVRLVDGALSRGEPPTTAPPSARPRERGSAPARSGPAGRLRTPGR